MTRTAPDCSGREPTVWYAFRPSAAVRVEANTFGSDYDTTLSVYTGARGDLAQLACDDTGGRQSQVESSTTTTNPAAVWSAPHDRRRGDRRRIVGRGLV